MKLGAEVLINLALAFHVWEMVAGFVSMLSLRRNPGLFKLRHWLYLVVPFYGLVMWTIALEDLK